MRGFREASPAGPAWNIGKSLCQTIIFWGTFLFLLPWLLTIVDERLGFHSFEFPLQRVVGAVVFVSFGSLGIGSLFTMAVSGKGTPLPLDTARELVVSGPYRYVRNPMAIAGLSQAMGVGLWLGSPSVFAYVVSGFFCWHLFVRPIEERDLRERFGASYEAYCQAVKCWIPRFRGYRSNSG